MKTIKGMFWHCHHNILCEYVYDYQERVNYIKKNKPKNEIKTRLKLFKKVKGKLPKEFVEAGKKCDKAREKYIKAEEKCDKAREKYIKAREKYDKAREKYDKAWEKYIKAEEKYNKAWGKYEPQIEKLHKKECGCKEWNGKELVFKK